MKRKIAFLIAVTTILAATSLTLTATQSDPNPVRVAVIGGMTMTPLWSEIQKRFEAETGIPVRVVVTGEKPALARAMKEGKVDFLTMHSSDQTSNLVADGYARDLHPWAKNELVIVGPSDDPAGISGMTNGAEAIKKIAAVQANWIDFHSVGPREMAHTLFASVKVKMIGPWVLKYENTSTKSILHYAADNNAHMILGRMAIVFRKIEPDPKIKILVQGDPNMRRPYMLMAANPDRFPDTNLEGAKKLSDFLLSDKIQKFLAGFDGGIGDGKPIFFPIKQPR